MCSASPVVVGVPPAVCGQLADGTVQVWPGVEPSEQPVSAVVPAAFAASFAPASPADPAASEAIRIRTVSKALRAAFASPALKRAPGSAARRCTVAWFEEVRLKSRPPPARFVPAAVPGGTGSGCTATPGRYQSRITRGCQSPSRPTETASSTRSRCEAGAEKYKSSRPEVPVPGQSETAIVQVLPTAVPSVQPVSAVFPAESLEIFAPVIPTEESSAVNCCVTWIRTESKALLAAFAWAGSQSSPRFWSRMKTETRCVSPLSASGRQPETEPAGGSAPPASRGTACAHACGRGRNRNDPVRASKPAFETVAVRYAGAVRPAGSRRYSACCSVRSGVPLVACGQLAEAIVQVGPTAPSEQAAIAAVPAWFEAISAPVIGIVPAASALICSTTWSNPLRSTFASVEVNTPECAAARSIT